jgi:hypothetical protein
MKISLRRMGARIAAEAHRNQIAVRTRSERLYCAGESRRESRKLMDNEKGAPRAE